MPYSQEERLIALTTPLGEDVLLLAGFSGHEAISRLFSFQLDLLSEQGPIDFAKIIGKKVTIRVTQADKTARYFNGIVSHFAQSGSDTRFTRYQMQWFPGPGRSPDTRIAKFFTTRRSRKSSNRSSRIGAYRLHDQAQRQLLAD